MLINHLYINYAGSELIKKDGKDFLTLLGSLQTGNF